MEQLSIFDSSAFNEFINRPCISPTCNVGLYPDDLAPYMFTSQRYCKPCISKRHKESKTYRSVVGRESSHSRRSWSGYDGSTVLEFRMYLGQDAWDLPVLSSMVDASIGKPCDGCRKPYEIKGEQPHLIQHISDAHIDVIEPLLRPGMSNLQILCGTCNSSKQDMTYAQWVGTQMGYEHNAHAEVAARKVA